MTRAGLIGLAALGLLSACATRAPEPAMPAPDYYGTL